MSTHMIIQSNFVISIITSISVNLQLMLDFTVWGNCIVFKRIGLSWPCFDHIDPLEINSYRGIANSQHICGFSLLNDILLLNKSYIKIYGRSDD